MSLYLQVERSAQAAKRASAQLAMLSSSAKAAALKAMAAAVLKHRQDILRENAKDLKAAAAAGLAPALQKRLALDDKKIEGIAKSLRQVAALPDPVGRLISSKRRPNGLVIRKVGVPIGTILIIYESRPNVTADCMALCLKSGNSVILKGGREAVHTNTILYRVMSQAAVRAGVPQGAAVFIATSDRGAVKHLLQMSGTIDLVIPRGGEGLIRNVAELSRIPVIKHYKGVCHAYVDRSADLDKAEAIIVNGKTQNPSVCNALESLLVDERVAGRFLPRICRVLKEKHVEIRGCHRSRAIVQGLKAAGADDWGREYLDLILSVKVVRGLDEAVAHIRRYGSQHSDVIITEDRKAALRFTHEVDSACVFVNSSTRFNDGGEFGMGAEMGISTDKLHARGPMGLEELTSYKYVVTGSGQVRR